ncbi:MAG: type III pantothenate kinase [Magnetococcales bacterium]|nr:type III pantothenate kinase [Magnetococcales bacterium]
MLLVIDVGNTNIVLGVYEGPRLVRHWRIATRVERTGDEYGILIVNLFRLSGLDLGQVQGVIIGSVVPPIQSALIRTLRRYMTITPLIVGPGIKTGMSIRYDNPKEVGADRIVNAVAAFECVKSAAIVVDFGTATTFDLVADNGDYLGGAIAPGPGLALDALFEKTAKLPRVELAEPKSVIGRDTVTSMQSGLYWGYVGMVDSLIDRISEESELPGIQVIATGGLARLITKETQKIDRIEEFLTLDGLRLLYERNQT